MFQLRLAELRADALAVVLFSSTTLRPLLAPGIGSRSPFAAWRWTPSAVRGPSSALASLARAALRVADSLDTLARLAQRAALRAGALVMRGQLLPPASAALVRAPHAHDACARLHASCARARCVALRACCGSAWHLRRWRGRTSGSSQPRAGLEQRELTPHPRSARVAADL
jgi:hypothetical protein